MLSFCRSFWGVPRTPVRQWGTLARLLVCHTATPSRMCAPREGSSRRLVAGGTAVGSRSKPLAFACACCHQHCTVVLFEQATVISNHFLLSSSTICCPGLNFERYLKDSWCYLLVKLRHNVLFASLTRDWVLFHGPFKVRLRSYVLWL